MLMLQRTIGNQAVLRLLRQQGLLKNENGNSGQPPSPLPAPPLPGPLQAKLKVGAVDDPLEQEADSVAEQVMRMPAPEVALTSAPPQMSRKCAECEEEGRLQKKEAGTPEAAASEAPGIVHEVLRSPGQPLDASSRAYFEPRFGHDFSRVRVHSGASAEQSARDVNAHAYTVGRDIVFDAGRFAPGTQEGRQLLAHELTHVVQQAGADGIRVGQSAEKRGLSPIPPAAEAIEAEAKENTKAALAPGPITPISNSAPYLARQPKEQPGAQTSPADRFIETLNHPPDNWIYFSDVVGRFVQSCDEGKAQNAGRASLKGLSRPRDKPFLRD
jgi:Domain of unknown function (DUF4157)